MENGEIRNHRSQPFSSTRTSRETGSTRTGHNSVALSSAPPGFKSIRFASSSAIGTTGIFVESRREQ